jgi:hypothetical protein
MNAVHSRRWAALAAVVCLASVASFASAAPVLQPSQTIEAPADPGPIQTESSIGGRVAIDGDQLLLGSAQGYLYRRDRSGDWNHRDTLLIPDANFQFRRGIVHGNTAVIATLFAHLDQLTGRLYVYRRVGGAWKLVQSIDEPTDEPGGFAEYGVAFDGKTIVIGAPLNNGAAFVYSRNPNGTFELAATLRETPPPAPFLLSYGASAAVDGNTLAIGATGANDSNGGVYVYHRAQGAWQLDQVLAASDPQFGAEFGNAIASSNDRLLVGARSADRSDDVPTLAGAAYVFSKQQGHQWHEERKIPNPTNGSFGWVLALDGRRAVIAANYIRPHDDDPYGTPLAFARAFAYDRKQGTWTLSAALEGFQPSNNFALDVAVQGRHVFSGDPTVHTPDPLFEGQAYEFTLPPSH